MPDFDPFALSSGLPEDYIGTIESAAFITDPKYNNGETVLLELTVVSPDPEVGTQSQRYPCGPQWRSYDGGQTIEHPNENAKINRQTAYGVLIQKALDVAGDVLRSRVSNYPLGPRDSRTWVGLTFRWQAEEEEKRFRDRQTGEEVTRRTRRIWPVELVGTDETAGASGDGDTEELSAGGVTVRIPSTLAAAVREAAKTSERHSDFVDAVMELPGAITHKDLLRAAANEKFYAGLR